MLLKKNKIYIFLFLSFLTVCMPYKLGSIPGIRELTNCIQVLVFLYTGFMVLKETIKKKDVVVALLLLYEATLFLVTIIGHQELYSYLILVFNRWSTIFFFVYGLKFCKDHFLKIGYCYFYSLIVIQFAVLLCGHFMMGINPDECMIINLANSMGNNYIFMAFMLLLHDLNDRGAISWVTGIGIGIIAISELILWAVTGMLGFFVFLILALAYLLISKLKNKGLPLNIYLAIILIIEIPVVLFQKLPPLLSSFVVNVLHKSPTFSGRFEVWQSYIQSFLESPFIGYGYGHISYWSTTKTNKLIFGENGKPIPAHNTILETLNQGGIVLLILFIFIFIFCLVKGYKSKKDSSIIPFFNATSSAILGFAVIAAAEQLDMAMFFVILYCLANLNIISNKNEEPA